MYLCQGSAFGTFSVSHNGTLIPNHVFISIFWYVITVNLRDRVLTSNHINQHIFFEIFRDVHFSFTHDSTHGTRVINKSTCFEPTLATLHASQYNHESQTRHILIFSFSCAIVPMDNSAGFSFFAGIATLSCFYFLLPSLFLSLLLIFL